MLRKEKAGEGEKKKKKGGTRHEGSRVGGEAKKEDGRKEGGRGKKRRRRRGGCKKERSKGRRRRDGVREAIGSLKMKEKSRSPYRLTLPRDTAKGGRTKARSERHPKGRVTHAKSSGPNARGDISARLRLRGLARRAPERRGLALQAAMGSACRGDEAQGSGCM